MHEQARVPPPRAAERFLVCVHGLTRNGRDFDALAGAMVAAGWRVVCPDVVGRGRSDWLSDARGYAQPQYMSDLATLIARLEVETVDWVGTSMEPEVESLLVEAAKY